MIATDSGSYLRWRTRLATYWRVDDQSPERSISIAVGARTASVAQRPGTSGRRITDGVLIDASLYRASGDDGSVAGWRSGRARRSSGASRADLAADLRVRGYTRHQGESLPLSTAESTTGQPTAGRRRSACPAAAADQPLQRVTRPAGRAGTLPDLRHARASRRIRSHVRAARSPGVMHGARRADADRSRGDPAGSVASPPLPPFPAADSSPTSTGTVTWRQRVAHGLWVRQLRSTIRAVGVEVGPAAAVLRVVRRADSSISSGSSRVWSRDEGSALRSGLARRDQATNQLRLSLVNVPAPPGLSSSPRA